MWCRAGWWGAGDWPCCSVAEAGSDGPGGAEIGSWAAGKWGEAQGEGERAWTDRASSTLQAITVVTFPWYAFLFPENHPDENILSRRLFGLSCVMVTNISTVCKCG